MEKRGALVIFLMFIIDNIQGEIKNHPPIISLGTLSTPFPASNFSNSDRVMSFFRPI